MPLPELTEDEIVGYLKKTQLPTILVEGKGDATVYRWIENNIGTLCGNILICSGRTTLLAVYERRAEFSHATVIFLADLDMWFYSSPPAAYDGIIFTTGYSIENDLYVGSNIESLLDPVERQHHSNLLSASCRWFAFEVMEFRQGRPTHHAAHICQVVDTKAMELSREFCDRRGYYEPDQHSFNEVLRNYQLGLRGKTLFQVLTHFLSSPKRVAKYSYANLVELCLKLHPDRVYINRIVELLRSRIQQASGNLPIESR